MAYRNALSYTIDDEGRKTHFSMRRISIPVRVEEFKDEIYAILESPNRYMTVAEIKSLMIVPQTSRVIWAVVELYPHRIKVKVQGSYVAKKVDLNLDI